MSKRWSILIAPVLGWLATGAWGQDSVEPIKPAEPKVAESAPAGAPTAEQDPAARRAMDRATDALRAARSISYDASFKSSGSLGSTLGFKSASGTVLMLRLGPDGTPAAGGRWALRAHGKGDSKGEKEVAFDVSWINGQIEWLDAEKKRLMERSDMEARGAAIMMPKTTMRVEGMIAEPPFRGDLDHATLSLEGQEEVAGARCDIVLMSRNSGGRRQRWYIGVDDGIPRRAVEIVAGSVGGELEITLGNVHVDVGDPPALGVDALHVPLPEGYSEDRVKAAARPPSPGPATPSASPPASTANPPPEPPKPAPPAPPAPKLFPDAELDQAGGGKVKFADLRGTVFVVDFYGSWCIPAPAWHAHLGTLIKQFAPTGVKFFGAGVRERDNANLVDDKHEPQRDFTLLLNADGVAHELGLRVFPATVVVDKDGHVVAIVQGARGEDSAKEVSDALQKALGLGAPGEKGDAKEAEKPPADEKPVEKPAETPPEKPASDPALDVKPK